MNEIREMFIAQRQRLGLTQKSISDQFGFKSSQLVSNFERGCSPWPLDKMGQLVKIVKLDREKVIYFLMREYERELRRAMR